MLRCGQVAYFSPNRPLEVPDSRFGSNPELPQQALEGQGWVGCPAVGGVQNQEHQDGALRNMTQFEASVQVGSASCGVTMLITQILWGYNAYNPDRVHGGDEVLRPW
ncbi:hypothetical protein ACFX1Z_024147 [Malus domestica]